MQIEITEFSSLKVTVLPTCLYKFMMQKINIKFLGNIKELRKKLKIIQM